MKTIMVNLMTVLLLAASSLAGDRLENDFKAVFVKHWQVSKEFTLAVAEAMPAASYNFKPNPQEMHSLWTFLTAECAEIGRGDRRKKL